MSGPASGTRRLLLDAALREFAERGAANASLLEINRLAGQRNRGAVHYHFGSREGVLVALIEDQADFLAQREGQLLEIARATPDTDLGSVIEAIARPAVELSETGWRGRCYLMIVLEIVEQDPDSVDPGVQEALTRTGGRAVYELLAQRMPALPEELRAERLSLAISFLLHAIARRARAIEDSPTGRPQLPSEMFVDNLVLMVARMLSSPDLG